MPRLFVALVPPVPVRSELARLAGPLPGVRWTPEDNLHLTLRFIGETDEVWLDEEDGQALGFHQLIPHAPGVLELDLFFTANAAQGRGVGRRLFDHMAARARDLGAGAVVISSNPKAAEFYRRMGAVDIGVSPPAGAITWERPRLRLPL